LKLKRILAISDIHGFYNEFKELLSLAKYNASSDQLILLGDYVDRGPNSREVVLLVKELAEKDGAIVLKGNHDQMFCDWLDNPSMHEDQFFRNGGICTIESFLRGENVSAISSDEIRDTLKKLYKEELQFLSGLPYYYEMDQFIFVHAGINPVHTDWKNTGESDLLWIRDPFLFADHPFHQTIVHGHTPTIKLHNKPDIYYGHNKIGIDGGCVLGYQLNCLEIQNKKFREYFVKNSVSAPFLL
jgi:serine/threonine protein phosphatase 1